MFKPSLLIVLILTCLCFHIVAQDQSGEASHLYRPAEARNTQQADSTVSDSATLSPGEVDTISTRVNQDSLNARLKYVQDSIAARMQFIQDSIRAREIFVRDSLARRQRILDSLHFLQERLPVLLEAGMKIHRDDIFIAQSPIEIIGDSMLSTCDFTLLPLGMDEAFRPWQISINPSAKNVSMVVDTVAGKITMLTTPYFTAQYSYSRNKGILRIDGKSILQNKRSGRVYKVPVDSVFFGKNGEINKIKQYAQYYAATPNYQRGAALFLHLEQVKQYEYSGNTLSKYEVVKFCDRDHASAPRKVCNIVRYAITRQGNTFTIVRSQEPENDFADGTFIYEYTPDFTLESVAFTNKKGTEKRKTILEVNEKGYVSRYIYQNDGIVRQTLLIHYYLDNPNAKHKVEKITCVFDKDGISYYQENNTTGKSRRRDRMTLEWSPWE